MAPGAQPHPLPQRQPAAEDRLAVEVAAEIVGERARRWVTLRRVLGQALERDGLEIDGKARHQPAQRRRIVMDRLGQRHC
ncbi:MAG TPA: hypothetical protein VF469_20140 [Kofleriaceae bacterium]